MGLSLVFAPYCNISIGNYLVSLSLFLSLFFLFIKTSILYSILRPSVKV